MENSAKKGSTVQLCRFHVVSALLLIGLAMMPLEVNAEPTHSTNIALNTAENTLVVANFEANSVTIFNVVSGNLVRTYAQRD